MHNDQYDPRLAGWVRALSLARAWTDPSWKVLILVGFVAAPTVHFLTDSMALPVAIAAVGFLPLVLCIATDVLVAGKLATLTSRDEFHMLQHVVDRDVASMRRNGLERHPHERIVELPSVTPVSRAGNHRGEPQESRRD